ncbi:MAG: S41 family peptidase [Isosphaeraceae bacterium]
MPRRSLLAIAMVGAVSLLCWQTSRGGARSDKDEVLQQYGLFVDALEQVEQNYVRPVDRKALLHSALRGMLQDLDPHSMFFSDTEWKVFERQYKGSFVGIGVQIDIDPRNNRLRVIAPMIGSPAYASGVLAGDVIMDVDGESTDGISRDKAVELLQGRPGTNVKLTVLHPGSDKTESLTVVRKVIDEPSVLGVERKADDTWNFLADEADKIAYVRVTHFYQPTADDLRKALEQARQQGMKAVILDLRDNPGGLLESAVEVSDLFIKKGKIVSTKGRAIRDRTWEARNEDTIIEDIPMIVMVNQHSASAAEIVSACLQDHDRAKVVGQRSYGKGSVQNILTLEDGASILKLTVATYWRPSGKNIHRFPRAKPSDEWGVSPSEGLAVPLSPAEYETWAEARRDRDLAMMVSQKRPQGDPARDKPLPKIEDKQLDKAIATLRDVLKGGAETEKKEAAE